jgi:hypothetical protein
MTGVEEAQNTAATEADKTRLASDMDGLKGGLSSINKWSKIARQISRKPKPCFGRRKMRCAIEDQLNALMKTLRTAQEVDNK